MTGSAEHLYRLPQVLSILAISKSSWWKGVRKGIYPQPQKLGPRTTCWKASEVHALAAHGLDWRKNIEVRHEAS